MGQVLTILKGRNNDSREQAPRHEHSSSLIPLYDTASSSSAPLALVSVGMHINPSEAGSHELPDSRLQFLLELALLRRLFTNNPHALIESLVLRQDYDLEAGGQQAHRLGAWRTGGGAVPRAWIESLVLRQDYDLEAGGQQAHWLGAWRTGGGAATPVQELSEVAKVLEGVMEQAFVVFLPACVTAYPLLKNVPDHIKFTIFGGLAFTTVGLFVGLQSRSVAHRRLVIRLVTSSAIAVLAFSVASQLSSPTFIALTALVAVALNLIIMLLPF